MRRAAIHIYQITDVDFANLLISKFKAGIEVTLLASQRIFSALVPLPLISVRGNT